ncbi:ubiquinone biosynthesis accessory factor UbiJ [Coxiella endosymbiont of Dermacentor marginatus]|uniref:ubiquinone biosynthesis accessory factor UbiJ n=1 Tax=Coxiella endosymbiont of Dermacentor marginatus TaxID=1656159 RepID=UPI0022226F28|nr:SCP2 sterol-binding domain-containing protein [Coxiella endosymbiont of Dermacentor marginatus]
MINAYLKLDSDSVQQLSHLKNKIIKIRITDWNTEFFILLTKKGLQLTASSNKEADIIIYGTLLNLFKICCAKKDSSATLFKNRVEINGDTHVGEQILKILINVEIDWEEHLSKITGDILAHQVGIHIRRIANFGKFILKTLRMNIQDYLQNESQVTPSSEEVESLTRSITDLRYSVDRAESQVLSLLTKKKRDQQHETASSISSIHSN